ncbi:MAG: metal-dependent hydrolase [Deltaproteobacteria bacterium]|nr:metal-dependent hydrolase [Deltaproteobacteria bacterium]MCX7952591.1 metal-dependent hydrolase [Deltaproteobacteria bacterium]
MMEAIFGGHSFIVLNVEKKQVAIDPWLDNPLCPAELKNIKPNLIVVTHGHLDHAGNVVSIANQANCPVVCIVELAHLLKKAGLHPDLAVEANKGGVIKLEGFEICLTHALHSSSFLLNGEMHYAGEACGVVIRYQDIAIYHAGDTALFADMDWVSYRWTPRVAFLPIGDVYTMGPEDAAEAAQIIQANITVPIHYKTFSVLTGTAEEFVNICKRDEVNSKIEVLEPGQALPIN